METKPPLPPFTLETAKAKVQAAEDAWNTRAPERVALAYTEDSQWRNRAEFFSGRTAIKEFLQRKWAKELDYRLKKELWCFMDNRITDAAFAIVKRPPISRRQLHLMVPSKGGKRRKYGGSTTRHGFRKGDLVSSPKGIGYVSGDTEKQLSVSDANWKRLGQIAVSKIQLIRRFNGLIVSH
jgi:Protein of unknown function (DUF1348)